MLDVIIALLPATVMGAVIFGWQALLTVAVCCATAVLSEFLFNIIVKKEQTISDLSAVVTGLLLGLNVRADAPIWQCIIGSVVAIVVVKCLFGGLGCNFVNPAITARVFMLLCFSGSTITYTLASTGEKITKVVGISGGATPNFTLSGVDAVSGSTPLGAIEAGDNLPSLLEMFLGFRSGAVGEVCIAALIVGFIYLVVRKVINFEVPLIFVGTVFVLYLIADNSFTTALYQVMAGGLVLGAVFMATDYVTTPITRTGKMVFAFGCGLITFLIRYFGSYPEGVSYSILIMNILSPYIEKWTNKRPLGGKKA